MNWTRLFSKKNPLFNITSHQSDCDKIYLCVKDPYESKHQLLITKQENTGLTIFRMVRFKKEPTPVFLLQLQQTYDLGLKTFWLLVLTLFSYCFKILRSYLVPVPNYWNWTKNTWTKNTSPKSCFSGQILIRLVFW